jgi:predicted aldo/keto reductase-like oxidoreductase
VRKLPGVQSVLSGMAELGHLKENISLFSVDVNDESYDKFTGEDEKRLFEACEVFRSEVSVLCTSCMYCLDGCPVDINIPKIIEIYNYNKTDRPWEKKKIESADSKGKPADCTECGICKIRCPQKLDIKSIMRELSN